MTIHELWRYPVKSMAGERLARAWVTKTGIDGDRVVHVRDSAGRVLTDAEAHESLARVMFDTGFQPDHLAEIVAAADRIEPGAPRGTVRCMSR